VFRDVDNSMRIAQEEIFGPVVSLIPYDDEADAIALANDSSYGLGGAIFCQDEQHGLAVARQIQSGSVGVNHHVLAIDAPYGEVKNSGLGRELGPDAL
jgi:aldehyde dehydrogenase (NAD+)